MEEQEKLQSKISDLEAELGVVSAKAESAEDTEDKNFYRQLHLEKVEEKNILLRLLEKEKEKEAFLLQKEAFLLQKEVLLLEKEKHLRTEKLLQLETLGARGTAAGLGVESMTGSGISHALQQMTEDLKKVASNLKHGSCASQSASNISLSQLEEIRQALHVVLVPVLGDPTFDDLFEAQGKAHAEQADFMWDDDVMEDRQSNAVMDEIKEKVSRLSPQPSSHRPQVKWFSWRGIALTHHFGEMPVSIKGKNDEVLGVTSFGKDAAGAVLGVELKKELSWQGVWQAETEFYLWQRSSQYPFCQVITDMKIGCAYYVEGINPEGYLVLRVRVFGSMEPLYNFMAELINGLPSDLNDQLRPRAPSSPLVTFPQELSAPLRIKPPRHAPPRAEQSASVPPFTAALKLISEMRDAEDDIANLHDVADWPE